jgi:hypothetical protein
MIDYIHTFRALESHLHSKLRASTTGVSNLMVTIHFIRCVLTILLGVLYYGCFNFMCLYYVCMFL